MEREERDGSDFGDYAESFERLADANTDVMNAHLDLHDYSHDYRIIRICERLHVASDLITWAQDELLALGNGTDNRSCKDGVTALQDAVEKHLEQQRLAA